VTTKKESARTDRYGDPLPPGAVARVGTARLRHRGHVYCVAFSPDGKALAAGDSYDTVCLWQTSTGRILLRLSGHGGSVTSLAFSPDGKVLAAGGCRVLCLWDASTGKGLAKFKADVRAVKALAFSPDGNLLAAGDSEGGVILWDVTTGKQRHHLRGHGHVVLAVAFAADGKTLVSASYDGTVCIWEAATGRRIRSLKGGGGFSSATFARSGTFLFSGMKEGTLRLLDVSSGREKHTIRGEADSASSVALSRDGRLLAFAASSDAVYLWDAATSKRLHCFHGHNGSGAVEALAFSPDGRLVASGGGDGSVRLWDVASGKEVHGDRGHQFGVMFVALSPDGRTLATGGKLQTVAPPEEVRLWDTSTGKALRALSGGDTYGCVFSPDGRLLATSHNGVLRLWEVSSGKKLLRLEGPAGILLTPAFSPDGTRLAVASGKEALVWEASTGKRLNRFTVAAAEDRGLSYARFSGDGRFLFASGWTLAAGWNLATGKVSWPDVPAPWDWIFSGSSGGRLWAWKGEGQEVRLGPPEEPAASIALRGHEAGLASLAFSPDDRYLASGDLEGTVILWEVISSKEVLRFQGDRGIVNHLAFSVDGRRLASATQVNTALVWDLVPQGESSRQADLRALWDDLAEQDAVRAYRAAWAMVARPRQTVPWVESYLRPSRPVACRLEELIAELNHPSFAVRRKAAEELDRLGEPAVPALRHALRSSPPLEVRRRVEGLLEKWSDPGRVVWRRQVVRGVAVLEGISNQDAQRVLQELSRGKADSLLTQEARAALLRLAHRR
jgi:WD40 repeat protein